MTKSLRQEKLLELLNKYQLKTQEELVEKLNDEGFNVTQATVSRDIKELDLVKVKEPSGRAYYQVAVEEDDEGIYENRVRTIFKECVLEISYAEFIVVVKTLPGMAQAAAHGIDLLKLDHVIGTIAGDDTIFVAVESKAYVPELIDAFKALL